MGREMTSCTQPLAGPNDDCSARDWPGRGRGEPTNPSILRWWSAHWNGGRQQPCIQCGRFALLRDDAGQPSHKVCAEAALAALLAQQTERESA